jgi:hypothetical protein
VLYCKDRKQFDKPIAMNQRCGVCVCVCLSVYCVGCVRGEGGGGCVCVGCVCERGEESVCIV